MARSRNMIYLVGLPGSGKTTLGKQLAERLNMTFIDLDDAIVEEVGKTIPQIFSREGEGNFRIHEREVLHSISAIQDNFIMATGGGAPCYHFNMDFMNDHGITIYLDVSPGDLAIRLMEEGIEKRPLFKSYDQLDLIQEIRDLKEKREAYYNEALIKIKDNKITADLIVSRLDSFQD